MDQIRHWIDRYARIGIRHLPKSERSGRYAFNLTCLMAAVTTPVWVVGYALVDFWGMATLWLTISTMCLFVFVPPIAK